VVAHNRNLDTTKREKRNITPVPEWVFIAIPFVLTSILWFGATQVLYSADDYQYLHHFAPMKSLADFFKQFHTTDPNSNYWRPLPSGLAVIDFLLWGWNGIGFHVTNFILHLICTVLVYFTARRIFNLSAVLSSFVMLIFGCAASHESNLLWAAGRTDVLATIFILATLLAEYSYRQRMNIIFKAAGVLFFFLAMVSKELGIFVIPLIFILFDLRSSSLLIEKIKRSFLQLLPYFISLILILLYRSQFVTGSITADIAFSSHSLKTFVLNSIYTIGYTILPIDFETATSLLNNYKLPILITTLLAAAIILFTFWKLSERHGYREYLIAILFIIISGFFTLQSFERWRAYLPSVGIFILAAILSRDIFFQLRNNSSKALWSAALFLFFGFHIVRTVEAENNWREASYELARIKDELKIPLGRHTERPVKVLLITRPAKLGSAPLLQLALTDVLNQAELERIHDPSLVTGGKPDAGIDGETAVMVYATEDNPHFNGLSVEKINDSTYRISAQQNSGIRLIPSITKEHAARRDQQYTIGDTLQSSFMRMILEKTESITAQQIKVEILDRSYLSIYYDGRTFKE
jgi:hypothetical protein